MSEEVFPKTSNLVRNQAGNETETMRQWFVSIDGDQYGPLPVAQLAKAIDAKELLLSDLVWREGMLDWAQLRDVPELKALFDKIRPAVESLPASTPANLAAPLAKQGENEIQLHETDTKSDPIAELLAKEIQLHETETESDPVAEHLPDESEEDDQANDDFSLANLIGEASAETLPEPDQIDASPAGHAHGDDSGLVDLERMIGEPDEIAVAEGGDALLGQGLVSDIPDFEHKFDSLAPQEYKIRLEQNKPVLMALVGGVGLLAVSVVAFTIIVSPEQPTQNPQTAAAASLEGSPAPVAAKLEKPTAAETTEAEDLPVQQIAQTAEPAELDKDTAAEMPDSDETVRPTARSSRQLQGFAAGGKVQSKESIDDLLERPMGKQAQPGTTRASAVTTSSRAEPRAGGKKPLQPSRRQTLAALRRVTPAVKACGKKSSGTAVAKISVSGSSGKVTDVKVRGVKRSVQRCMSRAISRARFPRFAKKSFTISYPFRL